MSALNQSDNLNISELIKVLKVRKNKLASTANLRQVRKV